MTDFRALLTEEMAKRCQQRPHYSLRAFARALDLDHSTLSKLLRGKRPIGPRMVKKLGRKLGLSPDIIARYAGTRRTAESAEAAEYQQMELDQFHIVGDWYHMALLELMRLDDFVADPKFAAQRLGLNVIEVQSALQRLERAGMLAIDSDGHWRDLTSTRTTTWSTTQTNAALKTLQAQLLDKAKLALDDTPLAERSQTAITMAIDSTKLPEAKELIRNFQRQLAALMSRGTSRDRVYNLTVSLYPMSSAPKTNDFTIASQANDQLQTVQKETPTC